MRDEEFDRLYADHAKPLFGFLVYRTGERALAEDLLAEAFERVLRARRRFDKRKASEKTWLYAIALNCLRDHHRRKAAEVRALERLETSPPTTDAASAFGVVEARDDLMTAMNALSDEEREVIALRYGADLTIPEIARLKKERLTTVEGRVYRGLRKLREEMT
jgi:RNA polymerase sigma factor (sigma-70 family)